jgi:hypothetical protein
VQAAERVVAGVEIGQIHARAPISGNISICSIPGCMTGFAFRPARGVGVGASCSIAQCEAQTMTRPRRISRRLAVRTAAGSGAVQWP